MGELASILSLYSQRPKEALALATLVKATGSTYRRPGARMLVLTNGGSAGAVSGGCLERDLVEKAQAACKKGESVLVTYDTSAQEDLVFGTGLGCKGAVHILLEPLRPGSSADELIRFVGSIFQQRHSGAAATVFQIQGDVPARIGDRLMLDTDGNVTGRVGDQELRNKMLATAAEALAANRSKTMEFELPGGQVEVLVEVIHAPAPLVIFGAGYDAVPLSRMAKEAGFHVTVADVRPAYAQAARFPEADVVKVVRPEEIAVLGLSPNTAAVIMSHNYLTDCAFLKAALPLNLRYLGLMGPRARALRMLQELREAGVEAGDVLLGRIHNPVGLDIGAENPEQIALAILAEIQAVIAGRPGGSLREKKGPIHAPTG
jgi:xanthine/CO dehydrogenase XdhC/CoxF family maturation factor